MEFTRRDTVKLAGAAMVAAVAVPTLGQGVDLTKDKIPTRLPLDEFVKDAALLAALRRGVRAMKARKASDPLSWFFQAAIHGATIDLIRNAAAGDPDMIAVDQKKYWNQCPHFGQASANFLPWHRAYTHFFERILRAHTGEPRFALPYWDYHRPENYYFPREFGTAELEQSLDGDTSNPLYHAERNVYFCDWQHWSDPSYKPYSQFTPEAVDWSRARNTAIFFGRHEREGLGGAIADEDSSSRGLLESFPHDPIHRLVGGLIPQPPLPNPQDPANPIPQPPAVGGMAFPPTAGFDPIFCVHHSNLDRLWAEWSCLPGKQWGSFPPQAWLDDAPWSFYDVELANGTLRAVEVSRPRKAYFDYRALGVSFKSEDPSQTPLKLPDPVPAPLAAAAALAPAQLLSRIETRGLVVNGLPTRIAVAPGAEKLRTPFSRQMPKANVLRPGRILMRLTGIDLGTVNATGFEVHLVRDSAARPKRGDPSFVGTIALFRHDGHATTAGNPHAHHGNAATPPQTPSDTFDVTDVVRAAGETDPARMFVVIIPYSLSATTEGGKAIVETSPLSFETVEFFTQSGP